VDKKKRPLGRPSILEEAVRRTITLDQAQLELMEDIARSKKVSLAWVIREAIDEYLERHPKAPAKAGAG
jgi:hypothetical protein